jgi:hypothetical protein
VLAQRHAIAKGLCFHGYTVELEKQAAILRDGWQIESQLIPAVLGFFGVKARAA